MLIRDKVAALWDGQDRSRGRGCNGRELWSRHRRHGHDLPVATSTRAILVTAVVCGETCCVAVVEQCGSTLLIQAKPLSGMVMQCDLQCVLSGSFAGEAREAYAKAASASSLVDGEELCRGALAWSCSSVEQASQNDARRLHRLEHSSKAHRQPILSKATLATQDNIKDGRKGRR